MAQAELTLKQHGFGQTRRRDLWWLQPLAVFAGLSTFVIYTTWAAFQGEYYAFGPYLSPLYSPELFGESSHSWFGPKPPWWPSALPWSPAFLILWAPLGFRLTCYYYRGAYYKSFWADPPACAVAEPRHSYLGENSFPLILHNIHRYFLYVALLFPIFLAYDVWNALWFTEEGTASFGLGVGTLVLAINVVLLSGYALGCHSLRHLVGGIRDRLSASPARLKAYNCVSCLNRRHMLWAWTSLVWVGFSDLYVRLCAMGIWTDLRIL
jgi:hypothetical protein